MLKLNIPRGLALLVLSGSLYGCVVVADPYGYQVSYVGGVVAVAPPAPRVEVYGVAPRPGYVWIGGYWNWVGGRHVWVAGHWSAPRAGYRWEGQHWVHGRDGWRLTRGRWVRR